LLAQFELFSCIFAIRLLEPRFMCFRYSAS
jgi:hypothetical protein